MIIMKVMRKPVVDWAIKCLNSCSSRKPPMVWVAGYCNDMYGYVPIKRIQSGRRLRRRPSNALELDAVGVHG